MVWDQLVPEDDRLWITDERWWIKEQPTPPPDTTVRLGHFIGHRAQFIEHKRVGLYWNLPDAGVDQVPDAHRAVMLVGHLVFEVAVRRPNATLTVAGASLDDLLMLVWPTADAKSWPPQIGITDKTLESLNAPDEPD